MKHTVHVSSLSRAFFHNTKTAWVWLIIRLYVGYQWLEAGMDKFVSPAWRGKEAGGALRGFIANALSKTTGPHPDVQMWYASFLQHVVLPHAWAWSHFVTYGEMLVGLALIAGAFVWFSSLAGAVMNVSYLLAGSVSINPFLLLLEIALMAAWRIAGWWGVDRYRNRNNDIL